MKKLIPQLLGFTLPKPTKTVYTVLRQLVQWIPPGMIQRLADEHKLDIRKWSAVSHVVALGTKGQVFSATYSLREAR